MFKQSFIVFHNPFEYIFCVFVLLCKASRSFGTLLSKTNGTLKPQKLCSAPATEAKTVQIIIAYNACEAQDLYFISQLRNINNKNTYYSI